MLKIPTRAKTTDTRDKSMPKAEDRRRTVLQSWRSIVSTTLLRTWQQRWLRRQNGDSYQGIVVDVDVDTRLEIVE